jgi:TRAP-type C4-dicarboxylate transport system permease small subunit
MTVLRLAAAHFEEVVAGLFMVLMFLATFANVLARYMFNSPIQWAEEFSRYAFIWVVFAGAVVCTKRGRHIAIETFVQLLPGAARQALRLLADLCTLGLAAIVAYYGSALTLRATQITATLQIPQYVVYAVVPASAVLIFVHTIRDMTRRLRGVSRTGA